ncbi:acyltransferase family protein [Nitrincola sp. A-D6]|uniref:acyltransferase family protein n=1 Tax=Nitrincola sp. A-D6 TaxID=1545442 RepID=UPI00068C5B49|nr:acyltransferase [Nitrincola sp. A-D6]
MKNTLSELARGRDNNFNLLRAIAAILVLYSHSFALVVGSADAEPLKTSLGITWGYIAVDVFFITSGFLIIGSYYSRNNVLSFTWARILRIFPGLFISVLFCAFVVGLLFTTLDKFDYLTHPQTYKFIVKNSLLFFGIEYRLPNVFTELPWSHAVNGSLWTLPHEVKMYAILAATLVTATFISKKIFSFQTNNLVIAITVIALILHIINIFFPITHKSSTRLFTMFFIGCSIFIYREKIKLSSKVALIALTVTLIATLNKIAFNLIYIATIPYLIFYVAYIPKGRIRQFNKLGDYSYGLYIYAFPIQQSLIAFFPNISIYQMIALSLIITFLFALFSWHCIEKKFLKLKISTRKEEPSKKINIAT